MEQWELNFNWLKVQHFIKDKFGISVLPNLDTVLFLIGIQEIGKINTDYSKEDKLGITTLGMCVVLSQDGYFKQDGFDKSGWPIWKELKPFTPKDDIEEQNIFKNLVLLYFEQNYDLNKID
jgi:hypothetical protein